MIWPRLVCNAVYGRGVFTLKGQHIDLENGIITIADPKNKTARKAFMTNAVKDIFEKRMTERESLSSRTNEMAGR